MILCAYLSGANTIEEIAHFAELRQDWLSSMTGRQGESPSYDTIWWFLVRTEPTAFKGLIQRWLKGLTEDLKDQLLAIDGKRLRDISDNEHITHVVELFATESQLTLAQVRVPDKASERAALPEILDTVNVTGAIVSMDAMYAHVADVLEVRSRGADYIVGLKGNQGSLEAVVKNFFDQAYDVNYEGVEVTLDTTEGKGHGRSERREITATHDLDWRPQRAEWEVETLIEVRSERDVAGEVGRSIHYYVSSRRASAKNFSGWIRGHWSIENNLNHILDVIFEEDASMSDSGHSAENMALIRRLAMNVVRVLDPLDPKRGMATARRSAMLEPRYLRGLLGRLFG